MDRETVKIGRHAVEKYIKEMEYIGKPIKTTAEQEIRELFMRAERQPMDGALLLRLMNNGYQPADYYVNGKWRFVIINENFMKTCERIIYDRPKRRLKCLKTSYRKPKW